MSNFYDATFTWPAGPSKVIITGQFDRWAASTEMTKTSSGFSKTVPVPWNTKIAYKFIVDGQWKTDASAPQEWDGRGNLNNTYTSPPQPKTKTTEPPAPVPSVPVPAVKPEEKPVPNTTETVLATTGASSVASYVASGVGGAIAQLTGYDPINPQPIPVEETPAPAAPVSALAPVLEKYEPPVLSLEPIHDEPVVLHLPSSHITKEPTKEAKTEEVKHEEAKAVPIENAPEPYKEVNGTLPAELESPVTDTTSTSHPTEATTTTTATAVESAPKGATPAFPTKKEEEAGISPRTSNASPPTTPTKKIFPKPRKSMSESVASSSINESPSKRRKRDSFFGKLKEVFHHPPKKEKASP